MLIFQSAWVPFLLEGPLLFILLIRAFHRMRPQFMIQNYPISNNWKGNPTVVWEYGNETVSIPRKSRFVCFCTATGCGMDMDIVVLDEESREIDGMAVRAVMSLPPGVIDGSKQSDTEGAPQVVVTASTPEASARPLGRGSDSPDKVVSYHTRLILAIAAVMCLSHFHRKYLIRFPLINECHLIMHTSSPIQFVLT